MNGKGDEGYRRILKDDESLAMFMRQLKDFDRRFCDMMTSGNDFTIRLEVQGNKGKLEHARVHFESFERHEGEERPPGRGLRKGR